MRGSGEIEIEGERSPLGPDGVRLLIVGGVPGNTYEAPAISELGEPDPMAS